MAYIELENVVLDIPLMESVRSVRKNLVARYTGGRIAGAGRAVVRALDGISLRLESGTRLGLIGHNGAGKSTLLRLLAGIYEPTTGHIKREGRITPLFNPSIGMDPDDTGYQNIFNVGLLAGMSERELSRKAAEIADFTELGEFLNLPVRTYSSGMLVRLAFAISTAADPEILLLDEGIGAGDARFAKRANERLKSFYANLDILVLASHSDALVRELCNVAAMVERGRIVAYGPVDDVIEYYHYHTGAGDGAQSFVARNAGLRFEATRLEAGVPGVAITSESGVGRHRYVRVGDAIAAGKWYWEIHSSNLGALDGAIADNVIVGVAPALDAEGRVQGRGWRADGLRVTGNAKQPWGTPVVLPGERVLMLAFDIDAGRLWIGADGVWMGGGDPCAGVSPCFEDIGGPADRIVVVSHAGAGTPVVRVVDEPAALRFAPPGGFLPIGGGTRRAS